MDTSLQDFSCIEEALIERERFRQPVRDAADKYVGGPNADRRRLLQELEGSLPGVQSAEIAELLAIDLDTLENWSSHAGEPEHRLMVVTRLVATLRHAWTPKGILAWFHRPRREFEGMVPLNLLDDPATEPLLLGAAQSSRTQHGT